MYVDSYCTIIGTYLSLWKNLFVFRTDSMKSYFSSAVDGTLCLEMAHAALEVLHLPFSPVPPLLCYHFPRECLLNPSGQLLHQHWELGRDYSRGHPVFASHFSRETLVVHFESLPSTDSTHWEGRLGRFPDWGVPLSSALPSAEVHKCAPEHGWSANVTDFPSLPPQVPRTWKYLRARLAISSVPSGEMVSSGCCG